MFYKTWGGRLKLKTESGLRQAKNGSLKNVISRKNYLKSYQIQLYCK